MKQILSLTYVMIFVGCAHSDSAVVVTGVVVNGNGAPVPNAKVEIVYVSLKTDANGYFLL